MGEAVLQEIRFAIIRGDLEAFERGLSVEPCFIGTENLSSLLVWTAEKSPQRSLTPMLDALVERGWAPSTRERSAAVHALASLGREEALSAFIRRWGPSLDQPDVLGDPPLHTALTRYHRGSVRVLLAHGASLKTKNANDCTPLAALVSNALGDMEWMEQSRVHSEAVDLAWELRVRHKAPLGCEGLPIFERFLAHAGEHRLVHWATSRARRRLLRGALPSALPGKSAPVARL